MRRVRSTQAAIAFVMASGVSAQQIENPVGQFPREWSSEADTVIVHAPEIEAWPEFETIEARAAVEVSLTEGGSTVGTIRFTASTETNLDLRLVAIQDVELTGVNFSMLVEDAYNEQFEALVRNTVPANPQEVPLEVLLSYIAPDVEVPTPEGLQVEPPPIFYSTTPAILVQTDGDPLLAPIEDTRLQFVINTNWDLFRFRDREWFLLNDGAWLESRELTGPWTYTRRLPRDFDDLPADGNFAAAIEAMPAERPDGDPPTVLVSDRPAELILIEGGERLEAVGGDGLAYVTNTTSDLFLYQGDYYYLVSGRWFRAERLRGPWAHTTTLPSAFNEIEPDHPKGHVRAAIPDTEEARLAALEALIPRRATVSRDAGQDVSVMYQGEPEFEPIENTGVARAVNSPSDVLFVDGQYYLCSNAVWYVSDQAIGPWEVATDVPPSVYMIPPSSPSHHVTHVHVYESDEETVSTGYSAGYFGVTVAFGVAMYGTGWYYPPYAYYPPYGYPVYYPYPYSYGAGSYYNPNTGTYGRAVAGYGPYGGYGRTAAYNPETGAYGRGEAIWDSDEIAGRGVAYNPRTGTGVATSRYAYEDGGWGESLITRDDRWVYTESAWTDNSRRTEFETSGGATGVVERGQQGETFTRETEISRDDQSLSTQAARNEQGTVANIQTGEGESLTLARDAEGGDLYAGRDGNVYRRSEDGWQQHDGDTWQPVEAPQERAQQIEQRRAEAQDRFAGADFSAGLESARQQGSVSGDRFADRQAPSSSVPQISADSFQNRPSTGSRSLSSDRARELNRSYGARSGGYRRHNNRSFGGARGTRGGGFGGGRRR